MKEDEIIKDVTQDVMSADINQLDKAEPVVRALSDMGQIWKEMTEKFDRDRTCYICKKHLEDKEHFDMVKVPDSKVDKGLFVYACVCKGCNEE